MTQVLPDLQQASESVVRLLGEYFPQAPIDIVHEPLLSHFIVGAISPKADALVAFVSIPTTILTAEYRKKIEEVRKHARTSQEHMITQLSVNSVNELVFVKPDIARAVYEARKKEKK